MSKSRKIYFVWGRTNAPDAVKIKIIACSTLKAAKSFVKQNDRYYRNFEISEVIAE